MHIHFKETAIKDPWFIMGAGLVIIFGLAALLGPAMAPYDPWDMSFTPVSPASGEHLLGVNDAGQDILSELLYAIRSSVTFGLVSGGLALAIGVIMGVSAGWFGGVADAVLMRIADVLLAVPAVMILILFAALLRPSPWSLAGILALLIWPTISKGIRAQTLSIKQSLHVKAAAQMGGGKWYILGRHLIPELYPLYLVGFAAKARMAMFMEASLAFLGLFEPTRKSLGIMISYALKYYYMDIWWNWLFPPILCLSLLIMTVTFLAISLEKILDPRLREVLGEESG
jgi:peptide/nickel transport system permease protein